MSDLTIRTAHVADVPALHRLAQLDSQEDLAGDVLVAEVCGTPVAALETDSGRAIADPFEPTAQVVELLRVRSDGAPGSPTRGRRPRLRVA